jgi:DNA repair ATPase RecN
MKKLLILLLLLLPSPKKASAQAVEIAQLLLNIEKLSQLEEILETLKKGYEILTVGYNTIKDISEGNFKLHKAFLDALLEVNPAVKNYAKVPEIVEYQLALVQQYRNALRRFRQDAHFTASELDYMERVYERLFRQSVRDLDDLLMVITSDKLRMSDDERLKAIDHIHESMRDKLVFLRHFNGNTTILAVQRAREKSDIETLRTVYGIN